MQIMLFIVEGLTPALKPKGETESPLPGQAINSLSLVNWQAWARNLSWCNLVAVNSTTRLSWEIPRSILCYGLGILGRREAMPFVIFWMAPELLPEDFPSHSIPPIIPMQPAFSTLVFVPLPLIQGEHTCGTQ